MMVSAYKPTAWFGGLLALTMVVAFLAEVLVVPAVITLVPRHRSARTPSRGADARGVMDRGRRACVEVRIAMLRVLLAAPQRRAQVDG